MSIDLYFERISSDNFRYLQEEASEEAYQAVSRSEAIRAYSAKHTIASTDSRTGQVQTVCIQMGFWDVMLDIVTASDENNIPLWNVFGGNKSMSDFQADTSTCGKTIGNFMMGITPLFGIQAEELDDHVFQLQAINQRDLQRQVGIASVRDNLKRFNEDEIASLLAEIHSYLQTITELFRQAQESEDGIVWYIA